MRRPRVILVAALAVALAGTVTAAAASDDPSGVEPSVTASCPPPGQGAGLDSVEVKDGKVYFNGKEVAKASADGPLTVAVKDGEVYVGKAAEKIAPPPGATVESRPAPGEAGTVGGEAGGRILAHGTRVFKEGDSPDMPGKPGEPGVTCAFTTQPKK